jgi:glutaredoxin 3
MISIEAFIPGQNPRRPAAFSLGMNPFESIFSFLNEGKKNFVKSQAGNYDSVAIRSKINNLVQENPVFMFSFTTCPFCIKAKAILDEKGATYKVVELDVVPDGKAIRAEMGDLLGRTSVPAIWIGGTFIGGCNDVSNKERYLYIVTHRHSVSDDVFVMSQKHCVFHKIYEYA